MPDLKFSQALPSLDERRVIDAVVARPPQEQRGERWVIGGMAREREVRHLLLPGLHALQDAMGWISTGGLTYLSERLQVPIAEAYGVATFYDLFRFEAPSGGRPVHHVCVDPVCASANSASYITELRAKGTLVHESPCLGQCERPPATFIQGVNGETKDLTTINSAPVAVATDQRNRLLKRINNMAASDLRSYKGHGGYEALQVAIEAGAAAVIELLKQSGLTGRGGAAFPTGIKWESVANQPSLPKYVVANADESEPGTFKDRIILENDPFSLIEAMTIAGITTGCTKGWIYIRGEYTTATQRLSAAIAEASASQLLGDDILGSGLDFEIEIRRGAGAYICGEETSLFNSIEGYRGEPRSKPPYPTERGLFDRPTIVNNPETFLNVLEVVNNGVEDYRSTGTHQSPGTKLFCLSGHISQPGLYEAEFGVTLRELLTRAGGVVGDLQAILLGGAAGSFVDARHLDIPLTFEDMRAAGLTLGSGAVMVFSSTADISSVLTRLAKFFQEESCGQCVPCRVGTMRQHEILTQIAGRQVTADDDSLLGDIATVMTDASICGLGQTAASAVQSALKLGLIKGHSS